VDRRVARFKAAIADVIACEDLKPFEAVVASFQQDHDAGLNEIAAALALMAQRERPLHAASSSTARGKGREEPRRSDGPAPPPRPPRAQRPSAEDRVRYRIEVGARHGVAPKNIVGAIANEAGLDSEHIGPIDIQDEFSTVELPEGMPKDLFTHLKKVWVCGRRLNISVVGDRGAEASPRREGKASRDADGRGRATREPSKVKRKKKPKREKKGKPAKA
jgi:ATP-dependent RNA helicase DeaD